MRKLSDEEQSELNRIIQERLGPWENVKWRGSRRNRSVRRAFIELPLSLPLPCTCENTYGGNQGPGDLTGLEAALNDTHPAAGYTTAIIYQNSRFVRHQRCGQVISVILRPTADPSPMTEAYVGPGGEVRGPYSRTLPFRDRTKKE